MSLDFNVITSLRNDRKLQGEPQNTAYTVIPTGEQSQFYLLGLHRDRLVQACKAFHRDSKELEGEEGLKNIKQHLQAELARFTGNDDPEAPLKLRLEFSRLNEFSVTASYVPTVPLAALFPTNLDQILTLTGATYRVFISPRRAEANLFTKHKTTHRRHYDEQRALLPALSALRGAADILQEMLIINESRGEIMEGTITTPFFSRNSEWITPSETCGGHLGVTRRWALMKSLAKEGVIMAEDVAIGETVILSNGVRGFGWGKVEALKETGVGDAESRKQL